MMVSIRAVKSVSMMSSVAIGVSTIGVSVSVIGIVAVGMMRDHFIDGCIAFKIEFK